MSAQAVVKVTGNDFSRVPTDLFIGGKWVPGAEGKRIDVVDPSTEKRIASVANATVADAIKAVDAAYQAGAAWAATAVGTENLKSSGDGVRPGWGVNE